MQADPQDMNELFEAAKPELLALPFSSLEPPRITRARALSLTRAMLKQLKDVVPLFSAELSTQRARERAADYASLSAKAQVYYAADRVVEAPWTAEKRARRKELVRLVREHDRHLSSWAVPVFRLDEEASAEVASILRGEGLRDDADDVLRLARLFRKKWADVKGKIPVRWEDLVAAEADANELLQILEVIDSDSPGSPRDYRKRAFSAWVISYNELLAAARFVLRNDSEAAQRLPVASAEPMGIAAEEEDPEDEEEAPRTERDGGAGS